MIKPDSLGRFECRGTELLLCEPIFDESVDGAPIPGAVRSIRIPIEPGAWLVSSIFDEDDPVYPLEMNLRHEDAPMSVSPVEPLRSLWTRVGRLMVIDALAASSDELRQAFVNHARRDDYVANEHDRVFERGLIVSLGSAVAAPIFVERREGRAVAIRIHNPWHAILHQRIRNRLMDHFEVASWVDPQRQHAASAHLLDWRPLDRVDANTEFPDPSYTPAERDAILDYDRAWNAAGGGATLPLVPDIIGTSFWERLRPAAAAAFATFRVRGSLPEDEELASSAKGSEGNVVP
jgi:hypothetical protein